MTITQIHITDIKSIVNEIERSNCDCNALLSMVKGEIENQQVNDYYNKIIVRNVSDSILTIIIDCNKNKIEAVGFHGLIKISSKELFEMYKYYREGYSMRDDLYFYFFNEDKKFGDYRLSFFEPSHGQVNIHKSEESLSNLTLSWG